MTARAVVCLIVVSTVHASTPGASEWQTLLNSYGVLATVAGNGANGNDNPDSNDWKVAFENGPAVAADLSNPHMAMGDAFGNIYIADKASHSVLKVGADGIVRTWAGTHAAGFNGDGPGLATALKLNDPNGLYTLPDGTVFIYDPGNHRIRKVTPGGVMTTVVNDTDPRWASSGRGLWVSNAQNLIFYTMEVTNPNGSGTIGGVLKKWTPTGGIQAVTSYPANPTTATLSFRNPGNIDVHPLTGLVYVTDRAEDDPVRSRVWRVNADGTTTAVAGTGGSTPMGGDGFPASLTFLDQVRGICFRPDGSYFLATHKGADIWFVDTAGVIHLFIHGRGKGDVRNFDGWHPPITGEAFSEPRSVTLTPAGHLLIATNDSGFVRKVGNVCPVVPPEFNGFSVTPSQGAWLSWQSTAASTYIVEKSTSLSSGVWQPIGVVTAPQGLGEFIDPLATGTPRAFYRLSPPR